ncbi:hypothetical protein TSOC_007433 [Tetrabaena socialis]|uniref:Protein kinase domain-containing protein n=1 Tax=Tetrabaena socialis TaxID=47790 RepID=A0A2J8A152_9CHLO|nr:hypothetical protein TSOC_007433 [Tetrabaena socialis]|eukprot:PNH06218.1 hypothetical protein TSOC_007433 [Tetrabaena socialis]
MPPIGRREWRPQKDALGMGQLGRVWLALLVVLLLEDGGKPQGAVRAQQTTNSTGGLPICGPETHMLCPSNTCCGSEWDASFRKCEASPQACQVRCITGYGLCGPVPELQNILFVRSEPATAATAFASSTVVYLVALDAQLTYTAAAQYCRSSSYMGFSWAVVTPADAIGWTTSLDTRQGAYVAIAAGGYFWLAANETQVAAAPSRACGRAAFSIARGRDLFPHMIAPAPCDTTTTIATAICRAEARQNASTLGLRPGLQWTRGMHTLSLARRLGGGPYSNGSCAFLAGSASAAAVAAAAAAAAGSSLLNRPITSISVSTAITLSNGTDSAAVVTALRIGLSGTPVVNSMTTIGNVSTAGWQGLDLGAGEVVTAVSGCTGGFVERLVLHTSAGRLWTHPFLATSLCSSPFLEVAPPVGYLVGLQGFMGVHLESLQLVWGQPTTTDGAVVVLAAAFGRATLSVAEGRARWPLVVAPAAAAGMYGAAQYPSRCAAANLSRYWQHTYDNHHNHHNHHSHHISIHDYHNGLELQDLLMLTNSCTEFCDLGPLSAALGGALVGSVAAGSLASIRALTLALDVACGMAHIHSRNIVHGDLSASNVLLASCRRHADSQREVPPGVVNTAATEQLAARQPVEKLWRPELVAKVADFGFSTLQAASDLKDAEGVSGMGGRTFVPELTLEAGVELSAAIERMHAKLSGSHEPLAITAVLGRGSYGVVYLGTWHGLRVAVKTLVVHDALLGAEGRQRHRAILEAAVSMSLQHPHIVSTYASEVLPMAVVGDTAAAAASAVRSASAAAAAEASSDRTSSTAAMGSGGNSASRNGSVSAAIPDVYKLMLIQVRLEDEGDRTG